MRRTEIRVERVDSFFERGRKLAKAADRGNAIPSSRVVAFEDVESLLHVLTEKRVLLLRQVNQTPTSISLLAKNLKRDRSLMRTCKGTKTLSVLYLHDQDNDCSNRNYQNEIFSINLRVFNKVEKLS